MFLRDISRISNRIAIADAEGIQFTYGELDDLSLEYKKWIIPRSLIIILCDYSIDTVAFYYCQMNNHVVPILVDRKLEEGLLTNIIENYKPEFIWCSQEDKNKLQGISMQKIFQKGEHVLMRLPYEKVEIHPDLALLLTTSGSTGSLKMVRISYEHLRIESREFGNALGFKIDDCGISTMPMYFCYGLSILHMHWMVGAKIYVTEYSMLNMKFWELFKKAKITNFAGVPYTYDILKQIGFLEQHYEHMRFMLYGGGRFPDEQQREFGKKLQEKNIKLYVGYGQTESMSGITALSYKKILEKIGSVGETISGMDVSVFKPDDKGMGELVFKGKCVCMGYAIDRADLIRGDDNAGCLYTGDIGYVDADGDIFIKGRKSRFVKILGVRISLDELETALSSQLGISKLVCMGIDNEITVYHLADCEEKAILDFCSKKISIPKRMVKCRLVKEFPYTGSGKIKYADLM